MRIAVLLGFALVGCATPPLSIAEYEHQRIVDSAELRAYAKTAPRDVARAMGRIQSASYMTDLIALLGDEAARDDAIFALGQLGLDDKWNAASGETIVKALLPHSATSPALVVEALGKLKHLPTPELMGHADAHVRGKAAVAVWVSREGRYSEAALACLLTLVADADATVRTRAAFALSQPLQARAVDALTTLLQDDEPQARFFATRGLAQGRELPTRDAIVAALQPISNDANAAVRAEAVHALEELGAPIEDDFMFDSNPFVRAAAAPAHIDTALTDPSATVRRAGLLALGRSVTEEAIPEPLATFSGSADYRDRLAVAEALDGQKAGLAVLTDLANDPVEQVQAAALVSAQSLPKNLGQPLLLKALESTRLSVRTTAVAGLRASKAIVVRNAMRASFATSTGAAWVALREELLTIFSNDPEFLRAALSDPSPRIRARALYLLGEDATVDVPRPPAVVVRTLPSAPRYRVRTTRGSFDIETTPDLAPQHASSFETLVERQFYDSLTWHRVEANLLVQGGDPRGDGLGNGGVVIDDEINPQAFVRGTVGMPRDRKDTGGCQLLITLMPAPQLDGRFTVFGHVVSGWQVLEKLEAGDHFISIRRVAASSYE